jgi:hypothetical protein
MHNNPYAWSISPRQIARRLHCEHISDELTIEEEREQFDMFCEMMARKGKYYKSQLEAWRNWNFLYPPVLPWETNIEPPLHWEDDIRDIFNQQATAGNYNETGGQQ